MKQILTKNDNDIVQSSYEYCQLHETGYNEMSTSEKQQVRHRVYLKFRNMAAEIKL
jgi:hypothetical protein